jgi:hypothetical protein
MQYTAPMASIFFGAVVVVLSGNWLAGVLTSWGVYMMLAYFLRLSEVVLAKAFETYVKIVKMKEGKV